MQRPERAPKRLPKAGAPRVTSRDAAGAEATGRTLVCRLSVTLPEAIWISALSRRFPAARFDVLGRLPLENRAVLTDLKIVAPEPEEWTEEIRRLPAVRSVELLSQEPTGAYVRVVHTAEGFIPVLRRLKLLRQFPFPIQDGRATWTIVSQDSKIRRLVEELRRHSGGVEVTSVHSGLHERFADRLTPRQREIFQRARELGYFEVPRRITLTDLATKLGVTKSTLSEALAIVERKVVEAIDATRELPSSA